MNSSEAGHSDQTIIAQRDLDRWAEVLLRINHLNTLIQREIEAGAVVRARALSERARVACYGLFNEMLLSGAVNAACDPEYPFVHWHRGLAAEALGRVEEARLQFQAFADALSATGRSIPSPLTPLITEKCAQFNIELPRSHGA